jgi:hypothetical protein
VTSLGSSSVVGDEILYPASASVESPFARKCGEVSW